MNWIGHSNVFSYLACSPHPFIECSDEMQGKRNANTTDETLQIDTYHGYAMRKILPLSRKTVTCKSKVFLCLFGHNSRIHCFWLKNLNLFSQNITFRVINYLNLVEKIIRNWNVDEVSVPIISKDISWLIFINPPWKELMEQWSEHIRLINSYQLLISGRCTNTGGRMKGSLWTVATCS